MPMNTFKYLIMKTRSRSSKKNMLKRITIGNRVSIQKPLGKEEDVFLIDHALSFRYMELRNALENTPKIVGRLRNMLKYWNKKKEFSQSKVKIEKKFFEEVEEYEDMEIDNPMILKIKEDCVTLSLYGNKIASIDLCVEVRMQFLFSE